MKLNSLVAIFLFLFGAQAKAYFTTAESAEIGPAGQLRIGMMPQIKLSDGSGMNFTGFFDNTISEDKSLRVNVGIGDTDFYGGGSFKWIPIPDFENQPAIGGKVEFVYGREGSDSIVAFRFHPLVSKKLDTEYGWFVPYASIPIGWTTYKSKTESQIQLVGGTEYITEEAQNMTFGAELGLNGNKSFSYLAGYVVLLLDENLTLQRKR